MLGRFEQSITQDDLGDALDDTQYDFCLYDDSDTLTAKLLVSGGSQSCGKKRCWAKVKKIGWKYRDKRGFESGIQKISMLGGPAGRGRIRVQGKNHAKKGRSSLPISIAGALEGASHVTVQVLADEECFEATLNTVKRADGIQFKAK